MSEFNFEYENTLIALRKYVLEAKDKMRDVWNFQTNFKIYDVFNYCCRTAKDESDSLWSYFGYFARCEWDIFEEWFKDEWPNADMNSILECHGGSLRYMDLFYQFGDIDTDGFENWLMEDALNQDWWYDLGFDDTHCHFISLLCNRKYDDKDICAAFYCAYITSRYTFADVSPVTVAGYIDSDIRETIDWYMKNEFPVRNDIVEYVNNFMENQVENFKEFVNINET